jgi:hypothetical protein
MWVERSSVPCGAFGVGWLSPCNRRPPAPRRACSLAALDPQSALKLLAALWATAAAAVRPRVQGGHHGRALAILEHWKACSNKRLRRPG